VMLPILGGCTYDRSKRTRWEGCVMVEATYAEGVPPDAVWSWDEECDDGPACEDCRWMGDSWEDAEEHCEETGHAVYCDVRKVYVWHRPAHKGQDGGA
jgi:hypothetical protein